MRTREEWDKWYAQSHTPLYESIVADSGPTDTLETTGVALIVAATAGLGLYTARLVSREAKARSELNRPGFPGGSTS